MPHLRESSYLLRLFVDDDAPSFVDAVLKSQATVGRWMPWAHSAYAESDALAWFERTSRARQDGSAHEFGIFLASTEKLVGGAGLNQPNKVHNFCNLGYWVAQSAQRRGAASAAVRALAQYAFTTLGFTRVEIVVASDNTASAGVALKVGAKFECRARNRLVVFGKPTEACVYSLVPAAEA